MPTTVPPACSTIWIRRRIVSPVVMRSSTMRTLLPLPDEARELVGQPHPSALPREALGRVDEDGPGRQRPRHAVGEDQRARPRREHDVGRPGGEVLRDDVAQALGERRLRGDQGLVDELRGVVTGGQEEVVARPVGAGPPENLEVDLLAGAGIGRGRRARRPRCSRGRRRAGARGHASAIRHGRGRSARAGGAASPAPRDGAGVPGSPVPRGMRGIPRARPSGGSPPGGDAGHSVRTRGCCRTGPLRSGAAASPRRFAAMVARPWWLARAGRVNRDVELRGRSLTLVPRPR